MLKLQPKEQIVMVLHKHWFIVARQAVLIVLLLLAAPFLVSLTPFFSAQFGTEIVEPITNLLLSLYILTLLLIFFLLWMDYYLDMWIITTERIIDMEQHGLFSREVSEVPLEHVQDATIEIRGVVETFLKFGTLKVQTAGEREFSIKGVTNIYEAKDAILKNSRRQRSDSNRSLTSQ